MGKLFDWRGMLGLPEPPPPFARSFTRDYPSERAAHDEARMLFADGWDVEHEGPIRGSGHGCGGSLLFALAVSVLSLVLLFAIPLAGIVAIGAGAVAWLMYAFGGAGGGYEVTYVRGEDADMEEEPDEDGE